MPTIHAEPFSRVYHRNAISRHGEQRCRRCVHPPGSDFVVGACRRRLPPLLLVVELPPLLLLGPAPRAGYVEVHIPRAGRHPALERKQRPGPRLGHRAVQPANARSSRGEPPAAPPRPPRPDRSAASPNEAATSEISGVSQPPAARAAPDQRHQDLLGLDGHLPLFAAGHRCVRLTRRSSELVLEQCGGFLGRRAAKKCRETPQRQPLPPQPLPNSPNQGGFYALGADLLPEELTVVESLRL